MPKQYKTEVDVRRALEQELRRPVPDATWTYLVSHNHVNDVLLADLSIKTLAKEARALLAMAAQLNSAHIRVPAQLMASDEGPRSEAAGDYSTERTRALSALVAKIASEHKGVRDFRAEVLNGLLLLPSEVEGWVTARDAEQGEYSFWLDDAHVTRAEWRSFERVDSSTHFYSGITSLVERDGSHAARPQVYVHTGPESARLVGNLVAGYQGHYPYLEYLTPGNDGYASYAGIRAGSVLDRLRILSELLAEHFRWDKAQATNFVLTGETPLLRRIELRSIYKPRPKALNYITIEVDPTVSPEELATYYRHLRNGRHRRMDSKHLALAVFSALRPQGERWAETLLRWNGQYNLQGWGYAPEQVRNFARDCKQAEHRLLEESMLASDQDEG